MRSLIGLAALGLFASGCVTSPVADIENAFVDFGLSPERASCLAGELKDRLDREDLRDVAEYIGTLNRVTSPGEALDALLSIDNPRAASAIARAGIDCAFNGF